MYFWDLDADGFAGVVLLKKCMFLKSGICGNRLSGAYLNSG